MQCHSPSVMLAYPWSRAHRHPPSYAPQLLESTAQMASSAAATASTSEGDCQICRTFSFSRHGS